MKIENNFNSTMINSVNSTNKINKIYDLKVSTPKEIINTEEKQFFANMFPEKKTEVMNYDFYNRAGKISAPQIGSLVDRRF